MILNKKSISAKVPILGAVLFCLLQAGLPRAQAGALPLFGPETFARQAGAPDTFTRAFDVCNTAASYRLVVENGADGKERVGSASVSLNGIEIVRPSDLNQRAERVEKEVTLQGENTLTVRLASNPGGFLTVSLFCASGCMDVVITSPTPGSTVNRARALVQGNLLNAYGETGVVLTSTGANGEVAALAQVQGDMFAGMVPLQPGENTLVATATDGCGYRVSQEVTVHADEATDSLRLSALPESGILDKTLGIFKTELRAEAVLPDAISQYAWDFDGDGKAEQVGADLSRITALYAQPGIYFPRVTVTDTQGVSYSETAVVNVLTREEMDVLLKAKWTALKGALVVKDFDKALPIFSKRTRGLYEEIFAALDEQMPQIAKGFGEILLRSVQENEAKYRIVRDEQWGGQDYPISYEIIFAKDENGIWKIERF